MKIFKLSLMTSLALVFLMWQGCGYVDPDINIDPNKAADVSPALLLPAAQTTLGYTLGGDVGRFTSIWTQQHAGSERQHTAYDVYQLKEADVNTAWSNFYSAALKDLDGVLLKAEEGGSPHYSGVAKVMKAYIMAQVVDLWNDVPYSQAGLGAENLAPAYDNAADIYAALQTSLTDAITDLAATESVLSPGSDDLLYGGNLASWTAFANTLSARLHLHLSAIDAGAYGRALDAITRGGFASNGDDAIVPFGNTSPWFQFNTDRGDVNVGAFIVDLMNASDDPRRSVYFTANEDGAYQGAVAGMPDNSPAISRFGSLYGSTASSIPLLTYVEAKFIEAEAAMGTSDAVRAAEAYNEAITASMAYSGVDGTDYIAINAAEDENSITMEKILTEKYVALYTQAEVFNDVRRTGIPNIAPAVGETEAAVRFPYPSSERLYNGANYPAGVTNFDPVFWDR